MTSQAERTSPPGPAEQSPVQDDRDSFAEIFDAHAQHIFDYCYSLLGERARAASATQVTLIAAHSLASRLTDAGRMRAFVLALARWECLSGGQGLPSAAEPDATSADGSDELDAALAFVDEDDEIGDPGTGELTLSDFEAASGLSLRGMLRALPRDQQEILDLVYRHEVSMADLAPLLGVTAASVPGRLAAARAKFAAAVSDAAPASALAGPPGPDVRAEQLSAVRLVSLPASVWRRTARVVMDPRFASYREAVSAHAEHLGPDGFPVQAAPIPSSRKLLMASALMAGLLLAPAAAGGAVYAAVSTLAHVVEHHHSTGVTPGGPSSGGSGSSAGGAHAAGGAKRAGSNAKGNLGAGLASLPAASRPRHHKSPSPVPTSRYSSPSSPWPSQTSTSPGSPSTSPSPSPSPSPSTSTSTSTSPSSSSTTSATPTDSDA